ncbi:MAG: alpha/beta hydrolase fold domain-containing protein [Planctomycetaceae bacterium]|nr:alpha/beta hydrolase fold domain-containing protein [Planctomycetaceae bacterium]
MNCQNSLRLLFAVLCLSSVVLLAQDQAESKDPDVNPVAAARLKLLDKNKDGKLSREELPDRIQPAFERLDRDGNGFLDVSEIGGNREQTRTNGGGMSNERLMASAPRSVIVEPDIAYRDGDSKAWRLDLIRPKAERDKPRPAIVFIHGGGWRSGDKRRGYFLQGAMDYAQKGYVCVTVNYRLTGEAPFPACIEDVKCAVRWLRANAKKYNIDPDKIGGYGNSAGAHLVAMLGLVGPDAQLEGDGPYQDQSSLLQAVCCSATPTDMSLFRRLTGRLKDDDGNDLAAKVSPITYAHSDAPPFLVIHGTGDRTVPVKHGDTFVNALKEANAGSVEYIRIDGAGHGVFNQHSKRTHPAMEKFFAKHLK